MDPPSSSSSSKHDPSRPLSLQTVVSSSSSSLHSFHSFHTQNTNESSSCSSPVNESTEYAAPAALTVKPPLIKPLTHIPPKSPMFYSPSKSFDPPPIPPKSPGRANSTAGSFRFLDRENRLSILQAHTNRFQQIASPISPTAPNNTTSPSYCAPKPQSTIVSALNHTQPLPSPLSPSEIPAASTTPPPPHPDSSFISDSLDSTPTSFSPAIRTALSPTTRTKTDVATATIGTTNLVSSNTKNTLIPSPTNSIDFTTEEEYINALISSPPLLPPDEDSPILDDISSFHTPLHTPINTQPTTPINTQFPPMPLPVIAPLQLPNTKNASNPAETTTTTTESKSSALSTRVLKTPTTQTPQSQNGPTPPPRSRNRIPSSFLSSYKIHEYLMEAAPNRLPLPQHMIADLSRWIVCVMIVQFDVEVGPDLKVIQPSIQFSEEDFKTICFSALPESTTTFPSNSISSSSSKNKSPLSSWSQFHTFRFEPSSTSLSQDLLNSTEKSPTSPGSPFVSGFRNSKELYGFSLYSQRPDPSASRGYIQESIVILSRLNYPQLFNACLQLLFDSFEQHFISLSLTKEFNNTPNNITDTFDFNLDKNSNNNNNNTENACDWPDSKNVANNNPLEPAVQLVYTRENLAAQILDEKLPIIYTALNNIAQWPDPKPNSTLELGFLGTIINISVPLHDSIPLLGTVELDTSSVNFHSMGRNTHRLSTIETPQQDQDDYYIPSDAPVITTSEPTGSWDYLINYISDFTSLYLLYEYVLLNKPVIIYASSPHLCSTFISLLVDLIKPIPYGGRIREYVTMHSCPPDFDTVGGITGITNPFLINSVRDYEKALIFVLSPNAKLQNAQKQAAKTLNSNTDIKSTSPYYYYRTFHNGIGILRRQNNLWAAFSSFVLSPSQDNLPLSNEPEKPAATGRTPVTNSNEKSPHSTNHASNRKHPEDSSMISKFFSKLGISSRRSVSQPSNASEKKNYNFSKPSSQQYKTVPVSEKHGKRNLSAPVTSDGTTPIVTKLEPLKHSSKLKNQKPIIHQQSINQLHCIENTKIDSDVQNAMKKSLKLHLKHRLVQPDLKFIDQLNKMTDLALEAFVANPSSMSFPEYKSIDFAIRFHFATLTSRFLSPLSCYLEPRRESTNQASSQLPIFSSGVPQITSSNYQPVKAIAPATGTVDPKDFNEQIFKTNLPNTSKSTLKSIRSQRSVKSPHTNKQEVTSGANNEFITSKRGGSVSTLMPGSHNTRTNIKQRPSSLYIDGSRNLEASRSVPGLNIRKASMSARSSSNKIASELSSRTKRYSLPPKLTMTFQSEQLPTYYPPLDADSEKILAEFLKTPSSITDSSFTKMSKINDDEFDFGLSDDPNSEEDGTNAQRTIESKREALRNSNQISHTIEDEIGYNFKAPETTTSTTMTSVLVTNHAPSSVQSTPKHSSFSKPASKSNPIRLVNNPITSRASVSVTSLKKITHSRSKSDTTDNSKPEKPIARSKSTSVKPTQSTGNNLGRRNSRRFSARFFSQLGFGKDHDNDNSDGMVISSPQLVTTTLDPAPLDPYAETLSIVGEDSASFSPTSNNFNTLAHPDETNNHDSFISNESPMTPSMFSSRSSSTSHSYNGKAHESHSVKRTPSITFKSTIHSSPQKSQGPHSDYSSSPVSISKPFSNHDYYSNLTTATQPIDQSLTNKQEVYKEFMSSSNFATWLKMNHTEVYN